VLGARFDEESVDNGTGFIQAYNTFWDVKTHLFQGGYAADCHSFSLLRFHEGRSGNGFLKW